MISIIGRVKIVDPFLLLRVIQCLIKYKEVDYAKAKEKENAPAEWIWTN